MDFIFPSVFPELGESSLIVPVFWEENGRVLHLRRAHQCPWLDAVQSQHGISAQDVRFPQEPASPLLRTPDLTRKALHPDLTWAQRAVPGGEGGPWSHTISAFLPNRPGEALKTEQKWKERKPLT